MFDQNISHAWVQARLSDFIDKQLPPTEQKQIEQHLVACAQCRAGAESLRWTIGLLKQAPVPTSSRVFALPATANKSMNWTFALAPLATAFATILFFVVLGFDLLSTTGVGAPARSAADQVIALAATPVPTLVAPKAAAEAATQVAPTIPTAKGLTPAATAPAGALQAPPPAPASALTPTQAPRAVGANAVPTTTQTLSPTIAPTASPPPQKTPTPTPTPVAVAQPIIAPVRVVETGLLLAMVVFAAITIILWRRK